MFAQMKVYLALGVLISFLAVGGLALWYRGQAISASAEAASARQQLSTAIDANKAANDALNTLQEQARATDRLVTSLNEKLRQTADELAAAKDAQDELERTDETVKSFLDTPVPPALGSLHHH
jgi:phage-related tail protein